MSLDLQDQRFLVTGASRGIGREIAVDLARRGAKVAGLATRTSNLTETQAEVEAAGGSFLALEGDVSKPETAQAAVDPAWYAAAYDAVRAGGRDPAAAPATGYVFF